MAGTERSWAQAYSALQARVERAAARAAQPASERRTRAVPQPRSARARFRAPAPVRTAVAGRCPARIRRVSRDEIARGRIAGLVRLGLRYALGLWRFRQVTALAELHAQRVRERAVDGTHGPDALVAHLLGRDHQIFAGHAELLGELDHLYLACCHCPLTFLRSHRDHCDIADRSGAGLTQKRTLRARFGQRSLWLTPCGGSHRRDQTRTCLTGLSECVTEPTAAQAALETFGLGTHIRAAARRARPAVHDHRSARRSGQPHEVSLRPSSPTSKTRAARRCLHDGVGSP